MDKNLERLLNRAESMLQRVEHLLPKPLEMPNWQQSSAWRYRRSTLGASVLEPIAHISTIALDDLKEIEGQKEKIIRNTLQLIQGKTANNVLLTGARGTGKSSLVKACLNAFSAQGLRLIEVDKADMAYLSDLMPVLMDAPFAFIIYCDDLSFDEGETGYKTLKSILDGSMGAQLNNVRIYATSNRRHLLPETMKENLSYQHSPDGQLHPGEATEEKISLSDRFGLWLSFYPFSQDEYLTIVNQWLLALQVPEQHLKQALQESLIWALERGARSGRVAQQFACDYAGRL